MERHWREYGSECVTHPTDPRKEILIYIGNYYLHRNLLLPDDAGPDAARAAPPRPPACGVTTGNNYLHRK
jgi:hypothetical protein